jgi:hypothetical protein
MKVRCETFFPGQVVEATLVGQVDQTSRDATSMRLEVRNGETPLQLPPPNALGAEVVDATPQEWKALTEAGYDLNQASFRTSYVFGNPHAPIGLGRYSVEVFVDGRIELVHERYERRRLWRARATSAMWRQLAFAIAGSGFPHMRGPTSAPAGTESFVLSVWSPDGTVSRVSGFPTAEYDEVEILSNHIVSQVSKGEIFGVELPVVIQYVSDARLAE